MVTFNFEFDKPDRKYKPGDTIHCKITVNILSKFKACYLSIRFKGYAHTQWERSVNKRSKTYEGDEEYFRDYQYMFGSRNNLEGHEVLEGTNVYNVSFTLPQRLPSSFVSGVGYGYVIYDVKAKYNVHRGLDKEKSVTFLVASTVDLNAFPHLRQPAKAVKKITFGCCCFESEPMQLTNILPKTGFVIGDTIPVKIQVENSSDVRLVSIIVKLKRQIKYTATSPDEDTKTETKTIKEHLIETAVEPFQNKLLETSFFLDPSFGWKVFSGCGIIDAIYFIKIEAETAGFHSNLSIKTVGITIGTIPFDELPSINGHNNENQATPLFNPTAPDETPVIMVQPLPSYNEAMRSLTPIDGATGDTGLQVTPLGAPLASTESILFDDNMPSAPAEHHSTAPPQYSDIT